MGLVGLLRTRLPVPEVSRRQFVIGLLASAGLVGVSRTIGMSAASTEAADVSRASPVNSAPLLPPPPTANRIPLPGGGELTKLPGDGDLLALTVDDGVNSEVVRQYTQLAKDTGIDKKAMTRVLCGRESLPVKDAVLLARYFGEADDFFADQYVRLIKLSNTTKHIAGAVCTHI